MSLILLWFTYLTKSASTKPDYLHSVFGAPGKDDVVADYVDGIEILERNLSKPVHRHIRYANYTSPINDEDYPWPGKDFNGTATWEALNNETNRVRAEFSRTNLTQADMYWHPVAAKQYYTTNEDLDRAERVKLRYVITSGYNRHVPPILIPPGEVAIMEISPGAVGKVRVTLNKYMSNIWTRKDGSPRYRQRLINPRVDNLKLSSTVNGVGMPWGATVNFDIVGNDPIEVNITGVIMCPWFTYGVHTDSEWENEMSKLPGPFTPVSTGNMEIALPAKFAKNFNRMNDCMKWYRSAYQISQTTATDGYNSNVQFGRPLNILELNIETFVPAGEAVAFVGRNFCHFPPYWSNSMFNFERIITNPWGPLHEINHHHQGNWAKANPTGSGEMSNNAINLVVYAQSNQASKGRTVTGGLRDWPIYSVLFTKLNDNNPYGLSLYSNMLHSFGVEQFKKFVQADQKDMYYPRSKYGNTGSEMLRASKIFGKNMRYHYHFHNCNDQRIGAAALEEVAKLNLSNYHPVTIPYSVGYLTSDSEGFVTGRPFTIPTVGCEIDFVRYMVKRANSTMFGDFVFLNATFEKGRESAWKEISKGRYLVTPKADYFEIEEVIVTYLDTTTNESIRCICHFDQSNQLMNLKRYNNVGNRGILAEYKNISESKQLPVSDEFVKMTSIPQLNNAPPGYLSMLIGTYTPPETGVYILSLTTDQEALFYLSEKPLALHPEIDAPYLTNHQKRFNLGYDSSNHSRPMVLEKNKSYHIVHLTYKTDGRGAGRSWIGYKKVGQNKFTNLPLTWISSKFISDKDKFLHQYQPKFEKIYEIDAFREITFIREDPSQWNVYKHPPGVIMTGMTPSGEGRESIYDVTKGLTDQDSSTEFRTYWWRGNIPAFPHIYEIDMNETKTIKSFNVAGTINERWFGIEGCLEIKVAPYNYTVTNESYSPSNYSLNHNESIVWIGNYSSTNSIIDLTKEATGRYFRLTFYNNSRRWKDNHAGRTSLNEIEIGRIVYPTKVIPMTNTKMIEKSIGWRETRAGCYYNGKGYVGTKGDTVKVTIPKGHRAFAFVGDYSPNIGYARVLVDEVLVGTIHDPVIPELEKRKLSTSSVSYKSILFYQHIDPSKPHTILLEVLSGEITLAAYLSDEKVLKYAEDEERVVKYKLGTINHRYSLKEADDPSYHYDYNHFKKGNKTSLKITSNLTDRFSDYNIYYSYSNNSKLARPLESQGLSETEDYQFDVYLFISHPPQCSMQPLAKVTSSEAGTNYQINDEDIPPQCIPEQTPVATSTPTVATSTPTVSPIPIEPTEGPTEVEGPTSVILYCPDSNYTELCDKYSSEWLTTKEYINSTLDLFVLSNLTSSSVNYTHKTIRNDILVTSKVINGRDNVNDVLETLSNNTKHLYILQIGNSSNATNPIDLSKLKTSCEVTVMSFNFNNKQNVKTLAEKDASTSYIKGDDGGTTKNVRLLMDSPRFNGSVKFSKLELIGVTLTENVTIGSPKVTLDMNTLRNLNVSLLTQPLKSLTVFAPNDNSATRVKLGTDELTVKSGNEQVTFKPKDITNSTIITVKTLATVILLELGEGVNKTNYSVGLEFDSSIPLESDLKLEFVGNWSSLGNVTHISVVSGHSEHVKVVNKPHNVIVDNENNSHSNTDKFRDKSQSFSTVIIVSIGVVVAVIIFIMVVLIVIKKRNPRMNSSSEGSGEIEKKANDCEF
ncbi:hypothetical protein TRFO_34611 [Tritrichomonas foetus]|uniref:PA14 domain-containing protein n=1 Tax=Tritrichomonas foetus TaxID=1144522 RepID=A0A1J4JK73_9EUKA|nr:hypothetical protein TRFO_34611 [Tritrichomonas foetus]|eukprot:OHS99001.1 hypothetical protein TRFO_34611 [Tritrichomonas foetus]